MATQIVAVGGGKGGVGKSFVSVNLAVAIAKMGYKVAILDADFGGANLHTLFGIMRPPFSVNDFVHGRAKTLEEISLETNVPGVRIITGSCDILGAADVDAQSRKKLLEALKDFPADVLVIDVGAGTSLSTVDLYNAADTRLVVMTPEITSAQNAYGFLKVATYRRLQRALDGHPAKDRLDDLLGESAFELGSSLERMETFLSLVRTEGLEEPFRLLLQEMNVKLVGNMLAQQKDRNVIWALKRMIGGFLDIDAQVLAAFRSNAKVRSSINTGTPLTAVGVADYDVAEFQRLAKAVVCQDRQKLEELRERIRAAMVAQGHDIEFGLDGVDIELELIEDPDEVEELQVLADGEAEADLSDADEVTVDVDISPEIVDRPAPSPEDHRSRSPSGAVERSSTRLDNAARPFASQLDRMRRTSSRGEVHVEVAFGGHWYLGVLIHAGRAQSTVRGVHPFGAELGSQCLLRAVHMDAEGEDRSPAPILVQLTDYDSESGTSDFRYVDVAKASDYVLYCREQRNRSRQGFVGAA